MGKVKEKTKEKYPYADVMLTIIRHEYEVENERKKTLDTKAATFIAANIALLTVFIPLIPFMTLKTYLQSAGTSGKVFTIMGLIILGISITLLLGSFIVLVYVAGTSEYKRVDLDSISKLVANQDKQDDTCVKKAFVDHYYNILRGTIDVPGNYSINTNRANKLQIGIKLTVFGYVGLFVSTIILRIIVN